MKVFLVYKRSQHDIYIEHDNPRLNWFIERHAKRYSESADQQHRTLDAVIKELGHQGISYEAVWRGDIKGQIAGVDAVVVVGGDGTFLEAARYCKGIPMVGVNSDSRPGGSQGFFSYFSIDNLADFGRFVDGQLPVTRMDRLRAELTDMFLDKTIVHDPLLSDVSIAPMPNDVVKYIIRAGTHEEEQTSDGYILALPQSSWPIYTYHGAILPIGQGYLQGVTRGIAGDRFRQHYDVIVAKFPFEVESLSREAVISFDGKHKSHDFGHGKTVTVSISKQPLDIIGFDDARRLKEYAVKREPRVLSISQHSPRYKGNAQPG